MATMFPDTLPQTDDVAYAERTMFEVFQKQLSNEYSVFHSFHWTEKTNTPREIDFVVFHPEKGFIVIEVKGGKIILENGKWFSENRKKSATISDPFQQVEKNLYFLLDFFQERTKQPFPGLATYGICFPDTKSVATHTHPKMTETNTLFNCHLNDIATWIDNLFNHPFYGYKHNSMNDKAAQDFINMLNPRLEIPLSLSTALRQQQKELVQINFFQEYLIDIFEDKNRVAFQGAAGTGKTWIAFKKAIRLVKQGKTCLFLCYNSMLRNKLKELAGKWTVDSDGKAGKLDVYTFHAYANHIFTEYIESIINTNDTQKDLFFKLVDEIYVDENITSTKGFIGILSNPAKKATGKQVINPYREKGLDERILKLIDSLISDNNEEYFDFNVPIALLTLLEDNSFLSEKYDALIIDEGQDFKKTWCDCLSCFFESNRRRIVYILYDDNQNIFMKKKQLPIIDLISKYNVKPYLFHLRKNIRNTKSIHNFAIDRTDLGKTAHSVDIEGIEPKEKVVNSEENARKEVEKIVTDLIHEHYISNNKIVVLTNRSIPHSIFRENKKIGDFHLTDTGKGITGENIRLRSISKFKGLESDVVILVIHPYEKQMKNWNELLYVGYTRAKFLLYVVRIEG